jgi:Ala-tRNA(Pro) deacylase
MYDASLVLDYLDRRGILYRVQRHAPSRSAQETAELEHVSGKRFAKTLVVRSGFGFILAVLPAHLHLDFRKLEHLHGRGPLRLAREEEFAGLFPDCEAGAMPPFGRLYRQPGRTIPEAIAVYIDDDLAIAPEVTFNACSHEHTLTVSGKDFLKAVEGKVGDISRR